MEKMQFFVDKESANPHERRSQIIIIFGTIVAYLLKICGKNSVKRSAPFFTISALNSSPLMLPKPHLMVISCETCDAIAINVPKFLEFQNYVNVVGAGNQTICRI